MPATKAQREKLTLKEAIDLMQQLNHAIEDNIDAIELDGGALPDWMATMLDEIEASIADRADALAMKIDEFTGYATTAQATKDRAARRQRVWENVIKSMKAYGLYQVQRDGVDGRIRGVTSTLRIQKNSQPSTDVALTDEQLLEICARDAAGILVAGYKPHALSPYMSVTRVVSIDRKALAAAYEARRDELVRESELLGVSDIPQSVMDQLPRVPDNATNPDDVYAALADIRRNYVTECLASEFPGVTVQRGVHLRID